MLKKLSIHNHMAKGFYNGLKGTPCLTPACSPHTLLIFHSATFPTKQFSSSPHHNLTGFLLAAIPHTAFILPPEDPNPSGPFFLGNLRILNVQDYITCTCYLLIPCVMLLVTASGLGRSVTFYKIILYTKIIHWWLHLAHLLSLTDKHILGGHKNIYVHHKYPNSFL